ncbi:hypothetical protein EXIGLDRAFT_719862 [Exidia glandulosa HHB12029]|uniref:Uncharacterized protein n=1 Tax=Exidia glandulosa HHB12029 TaxID=1314781 RepID=A0A165GS81_EXIGL|nr:hypothetical protein EXIGLDRAFT_719862 [Exidia glandulosa HHB12029]
MTLGTVHHRTPWAPAISRSNWSLRVNDSSAPVHSCARRVEPGNEEDQGAGTEVGDPARP